jgi:micrococcal nuclease
MHYLILLCLTLIIPSTQVRRVLDGDTFALWNVGLGNEERVRVLDIDTPERGQPGFAEATTFTVHWLAVGNFTITACKRDSFGRLLVVVSREGHMNLADSLYVNGLGVRP